MPTDIPGSGTLIRTEARGPVLLAVFDMPGRSMNVFSWGLMDALEALIDRVEHDPNVGALVIASAKETFLAGADLEMVRGFTEAGRTASRSALRDTCGRLGRLFCRLEALGKPTVAALNGLALGGGLEVAMACRLRVAADIPALQLGLPEIKLGLLPGAGGTQRLPRLIGIEKGLELLLNGKSVGGAEALALGLVDELATADDLIDRAVALAAAAITGPDAGRKPLRLDPGPFDLSAPDAVNAIARHFGYPDDLTRHYPAYRAIIRAVVEGANLPPVEAGEVEMQRFVDLMQDPVAGNMVTTLFLDRQKADKLTARVAIPPDLRFCVDGAGPAADALRAGLAVSRARLVERADATAADVIVTPPAHGGAADLILLAAGDVRFAEGVGIAYRRAAATGSALEIVVAGGDTDGRVTKALILARQLRATPYRHDGDRSVLAGLDDAARTAAERGSPPAAVLDAQARRAAELAAAELVGDPAMADVAAVVGGVFPAHAGGPFRHLAALETLDPGSAERRPGAP